MQGPPFFHVRKVVDQALTRWANAMPVRKIFHKAFASISDRQPGFKAPVGKRVAGGTHEQEQMKREQLNTTWIRL